MSFTDEGKILKIGKIFRVDSIRLTDHFNYFSDYFTTERNSQIDAELESWILVKDKYVYFYPTETNKGFKKNPNDAKQDVKDYLASLCLFEYADWYQSGFSLTTIRG